jgi:hypothetical protein
MDRGEEVRSVDTICFECFKSQDSCECLSPTQPLYSSEEKEQAASPVSKKPRIMERGEAIIPQESVDEPPIHLSFVQPPPSYRGTFAPKEKVSAFALNQRYAERGVKVKFFDNIIACSKVYDMSDRVGTLGPQEVCLEIADSFNQPYCFQFIQLILGSDNMRLTHVVHYCCATSMNDIHTFFTDSKKKILGKNPVFEVIRTTHRARVYFDIDILIEEDVNDTTWAEFRMEEIILQGVWDVMAQAKVPDASYKHVVLKERHRAIGVGKKYSFHVILPFCIMENNFSGEMRRLAQELDALLTPFIQGLFPHEPVNNVVDLRVYTRNRLLCCLGGVKPSSSITAYSEQRPMRLCNRSYGADFSSLQQLAMSWVSVPEKANTEGCYLFPTWHENIDKVFFTSRKDKGTPTPEIAPCIPYSEHEMVKRWANSFFNYRCTRFPSVEGQHLIMGPITIRNGKALVSALNDTYCEMKKRAHHGSNKRQTSYEICLLTSLTRQICFSCPLAGLSYKMSKIEDFDLYKVFIGTDNHALANCMKEEFEDGQVCVILPNLLNFCFIYDKVRPNNSHYNCVMTDSGLWVQGDLGFFKVGIVFPWLKRKFDLLMSVIPESDFNKRKRVTQQHKCRMSGKGISTLTEILKPMMTYRDTQDNFMRKLNRSDPFLIMLKDKQVLNLKTLTTRDSTGRDYYSINTNFSLLDITNPDHIARVKAYDDFILLIMNNDREKADYLQKIDGYSMTCDHRDRHFYTHLGSGANGKTTHDEAIATALGPFHRMVRSSFVAKKTTMASAAPSPDIMALQYVRYISCNETNLHMPMDDSRYSLDGHGGRSSSSSNCAFQFCHFTQARGWYEDT